MAQQVVVLAIHGMGDTQPDFADDLRDKLARRLRDDWSHVYFDSIYYQPVLQENQEAVFKRMVATGDLDYIKLRRFMLYGFSDAAGLERCAYKNGSPYEQVQRRILAALDRAYDFLGRSCPVVMVAHSLGCQVISNYIWDAQKANGATQGIWKDTGPSGAQPKSDKDRFRRLRTMRYLTTTGCNIPIFVAGFPESQIKPIATSSKGYSFQWKNYFDEDDVLGWPLKPLSKSYRTAIHRDIQINAGSILRSWNPLSHDAYWADSDLIKPLARDVRTLLP